MQSDDITRRNISEGRSYRNIIEFTEHGYRFKPEVDVDVKQNILVSTLPKGARKLKDVYEDLGTYADAAHYAGFKHFVSALEKGLEGVAEDRKAALINHYIGGKKINLSKDKEEYHLTAEGAELFKAFYTQSPNNHYKIREKMLREQELEHQAALAKGQYISDPLPKVVDDFVFIPEVRKGEILAEDVARARGQTYAFYAPTLKHHVEFRVADEGVFLAAQEALKKLHHRADLKAPVEAVEFKLAHRHDLDAPRLRRDDILPELRGITKRIAISDDAASLQARDELMPLLSKNKQDAFAQIPYPLKRLAQQTVNDFYVGVRRADDKQCVHVFTPKGYDDYQRIAERYAQKPTSQTSAQGDVDTLGKGKGKSK
jgi:hypothetical protein